MIASIKYAAAAIVLGALLTGLLRSALIKNPGSPTESADSGIVLGDFVRAEKLPEGFTAKVQGGRESKQIMIGSETRFAFAAIVQDDVQVSTKQEKLAECKLHLETSAHGWLSRGYRLVDGRMPDFQLLDPDKTIRVRRSFANDEHTVIVEQRFICTDRVTDVKVWAVADYDLKMLLAWADTVRPK
jgi:hypothetical protein